MDRRGGFPAPFLWGVRRAGWVSAPCWARSATARFARAELLQVQAPGPRKRRAAAASPATPRGGVAEGDRRPCTPGSSEGRVAGLAKGTRRGPRCRRSLPERSATSAAQAARRNNPLGSSSNDSPMFSSAAHRLRFSGLLPRGKASIPPRRLDAADGSQCHGALWRRIQRFDPSAAQIHHQLVGKHAQRFPAADRGQLDESQADVVTGHL